MELAQRRMFSLKIIDTDAFLDMPITARLLYYDLSMRADDDGFVASPKKIQRMVGSSDDDLKILIAKQFIMPFESGVCVIKHWRVHNYIQSDRYQATFYKLEKSMLLEKDGVYDVETECIQNVSKMSYQMDTQVRLGKVRLDKDINSISKDILVSKDLIPVIEQWNSLNLSQIKNIKGNRLKLLNARIKEYSIDEILKAIEIIKDCSFLKGQNKTNWTITFDWFIKPNNFPKVLEGNYIDKGEQHGELGKNTSPGEFKKSVEYDFSNI